MKTYKTILMFIFITIFILSCNHKDTKTTEVNCPDDFPQWVKDNEDWNQTYQTAYEKGQIYFNDDSSLMFALTGKPVEDSIWNKAKETIIVR